MQVGDIASMVDGLTLALASDSRAQVQRVRDMAVTSLHRHGHGYLIQDFDQGCGSSSQPHFDVGQSSGGGDYMTPAGADEYAIHLTAPQMTQDDTPTPRPDPFVHYRRRRRRRDASDLSPIDE